MADVQGPGRIRRDEFEDHRPACARGAPSVLLAEFVDPPQFARRGIRGQMEVDEAGARDFGARDERARRERGDDRLGEFPGTASGGLREAQRDVGRVVAVPRIARALDDDGRRISGRGQDGRTCTPPREGRTRHASAERPGWAYLLSTYARDLSAFALSSNRLIHGYSDGLEAERMTASENEGSARNGESLVGLPSRAEDAVFRSGRPEASFVVAFSLP